MNIVLIRPPRIGGAFETILIQEPINLAYIAAWLQAKGDNVRLWDFEVEPLSVPFLRRKAGEFRPDIAGITAMTPTVHNAHGLARVLKSIVPDCSIIAGGPHVSAVPEESLKAFSAFDYVGIGEGEQVMAGFCEAAGQNRAPSGIAGIAWRRGNDVRVNTPAPYIRNLDDIPFPARSLFNRRLYRRIYAAGLNLNKKKSTVVFTSRGCPHRCTFCAVQTTLGAQMRLRSAANVLRELEECKYRFGYDHITFEDTNLTVSRERFLEICRGLKMLGLTWDCQTRVDHVDEPLIGKMAACGCLKIAYGVESGSPRILKLMKKNISVLQVKQAFRWTRRAGIVACAFFILGGHPEESADDIRKTERLLHDIRPDVFQLGIICPYPGTQIYALMRQAGLIDTIEWQKLNFMHARPLRGTKYLTPRRLLWRQKMIYIRYILSAVFLFSLFKKLFSPGRLPQLLKLCRHLGYYLLFEKRR